MDDKAVREHLLYLLRGGGAHPSFEEVMSDFPIELRGEKPTGLPHTPWRLLEHMRIAQGDILEFCRDTRHVSPKFPDGYWPRDDSPPHDEAWDESVAAFDADLGGVQDLVAETPDLLARIPNGDGQTVLREALLTADHNAYHLGQVVLIRRLLESRGE